MSDHPLYEHTTFHLKETHISTRRRLKKQIHINGYKGTQKETQRDKKRLKSDVKRVQRDTK